MVIALLAVVHEHADSVLALRIVFSICLAIVFFAGIRILRIRKRLFDRDLEVTGGNYGARNFATLAGDPCLDPPDASANHGALECVVSQSPHLEHQNKEHMEIGVDSFVAATVDLAADRAVDPAKDLSELLERSCRLTKWASRTRSMESRMRFANRKRFDGFKMILRGKLDTPSPNC
jgi:hypothetical protein